MHRSAPLRLVRGSDPELPEALRQALAGGRPLAVLPDDDTAAARAVAVLRPEQPVDTDVAVVVATSGSTGEPKAVVLPVEAVRAAVAATEDRLGRAASWTSVLPPSAVGGLMVLARAVATGADLRRRSSDLA
uniref:AMP-binding protein n=1 Tax=Desertihabitans aurantiacus TaxID=2282477 RepID=UPI00130095A7